MKRYFVFVTAGVAALSLTACQFFQPGVSAAGAVTPSQAQTVAQKVCTVVQDAFPVVQSIPGLSATAQSDLVKAAPVATSLCASTGALTVATVQQAEQTVFAALTAALNESSIPHKATYIAGLAAAQLVVADVLAQNGVTATVSAAAPPAAAAGH
jgi:hypothetical protein